MLRSIHCSAIAAAMVLAAIAPSLAQTNAAPPSIEDFFRKPQYGGAVLSPSGRYLAVLVPVGEHRGFGIIDLDQRTPLRATSAAAGDVLRVLWQNDDRLIAFVGDLQRVAGEAPVESGVVAVNRDGTEQQVLGSLRGSRWTLQRIIPNSDEVLVSGPIRSRRSLDLYRLDTRTRKTVLLTFDLPGFVGRWVVDFDGVPRAAVTNDLDSDTSAWYVRKRGSGVWTKVEEAKLGRLRSTPMEFDPEGKILYVATRRDGADRSAIYEYDVENLRWGNAFIRHPERDIDSANAILIGDYRARKLLGLRYPNDRPGVEWFDAEWAGIQRSVDAALPDTVNIIQGRPDAKRWIVIAYSDRNPGEAYLLDGKSMRMEKLFSYRPWIDPKRTASTKWVRYPARDGMTIPALLTVPDGAGGKPVPLVVEIHGGPNVEATSWGYDARVQFFASRGYAVLQPQFRGTLGFGWKHESAGFRRWGDEMQDDLEDGVKWVVAQGVADPSRVCFYGASYGGYAALWGAIKNAGLIKCAVAAEAVTSIAYMFDNAQTDLSLIADRSTWMHDIIGDPKADAARFKRVSPLDNADKVGVPILLAYGGSDVRVPLVHGTDFRSALDRYHKEYEWVQYATEGHGFNRDENVFDFYSRVDAFLAKYLRSEGANASAAAAPNNKKTGLVTEPR